MRIHLQFSSVFLVCAVLLATSALAQQASGVGGLVRDSSGAVLPGVTVEAASPALIEKIRTVVTDGEGRYSIVDLRPGNYTVTFTLPGFSTVRREGLNLPGGFTAAVNAEMRVGGLEETITVTGESPIVDVQAVRQQTAVSDELLAALPSATKTWGTLATLTPGLNYASGLTSFTGTGGVYAENNPQRSNFGIVSTFHGKTGATTEYDGMATNYPASSGGMGYVSNAYTAEEMRVQTGGISAESKTSGMTFDMIPKEGGNTFSGLIYGHGTSGALQSSNLSDTLKSRGLTTGPQVDTLYDVATSLGGPVVRDRLWFFTTHRRTASKNQIPGLFYNATQSTPVYTPDRARPAVSDEFFRSDALRLTWQASPRNKFNVFADNQRNCACRTFQPNQAIEAMQQFDFRPQGLYQVTWSSPLTSRLLFEAGSSAAISRWHSKAQPESKPSDIPITEQRTGLLYNARAATIQTSPKFVQRFSTSYVTGSHAFKVGFLMEEGYSRGRTGANSDLAYQFLDGLPVQIQQNATPRPNNQILNPDLGVYAQDRWTVNRLTLNVGLRFDYFNAYVPAQHAPSGLWVPERNFDAVRNVPNWKSLNPRVGGAYDLFGNGRTALKASVGRYNGPTGVSALKIATAANPMVASVNSVTRTWNDANRNYVPDCDLVNPLANGECGQFSNLNFGKVNITTRYADDVTRGWKARDYLWDVSAEIQHQLVPALSVTGGYYRNWYGNFSVTDNLEVGPADFSPFCLTAPKDTRLPGGGGYQVCGLYDVSLAKFGRVNNLITQASHFGKQTRVNNFFTGSFSYRSSGLQAGGGIDTGQTVSDQCFTVDSPQQLLYCRQVIPFSAQMQIKMYATYPLPLPGSVVISTTWQNSSGPSIEANYPALNAEIAPSLGRNLAACGTRVPCTATASIPLIEPYTQFEGRRNQLDVRFSKTVRLPGRTRLQGNLDIFNVFNNAAITIRNNVFGSQWGRPQAIVEARLVQIGGQLTF